MDRNRVILAGASGLIGTSLLLALRGNRWQITQLVRRPAPANPEQIFWDPYAALPIADRSALAALDGAAAAINLAGANIAGHRWTASYKNLLRCQPCRPNAGSGVASGAAHAKAARARLRLRRRNLRKSSETRS